VLTIGTYIAGEKIVVFIIMSVERLGPWASCYFVLITKTIIARIKYFIQSLKILSIRRIVKMGRDPYSIVCNSQDIIKL